MNNELVGYPGTFPARVVSKVLATEEYRKEWLAELQEITARGRTMRELFYAKMIEQKTPGNWEFILNQKGLFTYLGISGIFINLD